MSGKLDMIFRPRSVAVVGASSRPGSIGREVLKNLINYEFEGKVFPVNPVRDVVLSMKAYPKVSDIPDEVDLAVIVVPKEGVLEVARDCGEKGVKGLVVITAGFKETGGKGKEREAELMEVVRQYEMRLVGPNCMGVLNTDPAIRLNASFAGTLPHQGNVAFMSQSGALGEALLGLASEINLGISMFASMGNRSDVGGHDLLEYWEKDPRTEVILMYIESFGDPRRFPPIARRVARSKPIVAVKAGTTLAGARAAYSHTGALAGLDLTIDALFEECGILRVESVEELFDVARMLCHQRVPKGNKVCIVTNAGGPGILATDACVNLGLEMSSLSEQTMTDLRYELNPEASVGNPVDLIASAGAADYDVALRRVLEDEEVDAVLTIVVPPVMIDAKAVAETIAAAHEQDRDKPMTTCFMARGPGSQAGWERLRQAGIPTYSFPEAAARCLQAAVQYSRFRSRAEEEPPRFSVEREKVEAIFEEAGGRAEATLTSQESMEVLRAYGIPTITTHYCEDLDALLEAGEELGYPVVLKLDAPTLSHKSDIGAVKPDLRDESELVRAYRVISELRRQIVAEGGRARFALQPMLRQCKETIIGMLIDANFGPLIMFGGGGIYVEIFRDVTFRLNPISPSKAASMIREVRMYPLLAGARGEEPVDQTLLQDCLLRVSQLVSDFHQIEEMEINPFLVAPEGTPSAAVDVRIKLGAP